MIKFGTGGFRGVIGEDFTKQNVDLIAQSLSNIIKNSKNKKPVVVGYDYRFMSDYFAKNFCCVLAGNGIDSLLFDRALPTPSVMAKTMDMDNDFGIMITASHNPYIYNGVKLFTKMGKDADLETTKMLEDEILKVENVFFSTFEDGVNSGKIKYIDGFSGYVGKIDKFIDNNIYNNNLKIAFDCMNGVTAPCIEYFRDKYKLNITVINSNHDAFFRFIAPAPNEKTLIDFKKYIIDNNFDIGFASDADGDRLGVIDNEGTFYSNNTIMAVIYYYLIKYKNLKGDIVKNNSTSYILDMLAKKLGYKCIEVPVGFKYISSALIENDALMGGESSGGLTIRGYIYGKDGTFSTMMLIETLANSGKSLKELYKEVKEFCGYNGTFIESSLKVKDKQKVIDTLNTCSPKFNKEILKINTEDGFKYFFADNSWANIRFSGTEPLLRIFTEASSPEEATRLLDVVNSYIAEIK